MERGFFKINKGVIMKESSFARDLRDRLKGKVHWTRIENLASPGIPDVNFFNGRDIWVELKIIKNKKVSFRPSQVSWARERNNYGGEVYVFARDSHELCIAKVTDLTEDLVYSDGGNRLAHIHITNLRKLGVCFVKPFNWNSIIQNVILKLGFNS